MSKYVLQEISLFIILCSFVPSPWLLHRYTADKDADCARKDEANFEQQFTSGSTTHFPLAKASKDESDYGADAKRDARR